MKWWRGRLRRSGIAAPLTASRSPPPVNGGRWPALTALFHEGWKYFLVSAVSLGLDIAVYWCLYRFAGVYYLAANVVSVSVGLIANYALSVRFVFAHHRLKSRRAEFAGFVAIGVAGLLVNEAGVAAFVGLVGLSRVLGKLAAAGVSFAFNFAARRFLLFSASSPP